MSMDANLLARGIREQAVVFRLQARNAFESSIRNVQYDSRFR